MEKLIATNEELEKIANGGTKKVEQAAPKQEIPEA